MYLALLLPIDKIMKRRTETSNSIPSKGQKPQELSINHWQLPSMKTLSRSILCMYCGAWLLVVTYEQLRNKVIGLVEVSCTKDLNTQALVKFHPKLCVRNTSPSIHTSYNSSWVFICISKSEQRVKWVWCTAYRKKLEGKVICTGGSIHRAGMALERNVLILRWARKAPLLTPIRHAF